MSRKTYSWVTGVIFCFIALGHLARILYGWEVVLQGWKMPMGASVVGFLIAGYLAFMGFRLGRRSEGTG